MPQMIAEDVLSWADDLDSQTADQAADSARLPFVKRPVALMADAHLGKGATIGSVIATEGAIIPAAVGVDIGCGMEAVRLDMKAKRLPNDLKRWHEKIAQAVPAGNKRSGSFAEPNVDPSTLTGAPPEVDIERAARQCGTLGGGNHFVEVCLDEEERVWIVLHSGSRATGANIADVHINGAKGLMAEMFIETPNPDLAYLVEGRPEFEAYVSAMLWAQDYAKRNRRQMLDSIIEALGVRPAAGSHISCHHNYCEREHHRGADVWVTRKGAIRARVGDLGIIPGSMATGCFIVEGLGNPSSYQSASHGAGRRMSRTKARKTLTTKSLDEAMSRIAWNENPKGLLDEHPRAYKSIEKVMENQADLVKVVHRLTTILNYKGV